MDRVVGAHAGFQSRGATVGRLVLYSFRQRPAVPAPLCPSCRGRSQITLQVPIPASWSVCSSGPAGILASGPTVVLQLGAAGVQALGQCVTAEPPCCGPCTVRSPFLRCTDRLPNAGGWLVIVYSGSVGSGLLKGGLSLGHCCITLFGAGVVAYSAAIPCSYAVRSSLLALIAGWPSVLCARSIH